MPPGFTSIDQFYPKHKGQIGNTTLQSIDFNGDGIPDILFITPDGLGNQVVRPYLGTGTNFIAQTTFTINNTDNYMYRTFDADGDGKTEIFIAYNIAGTQNFSYKLIFNLNPSDPKSCGGNYGLVYSQVISGYYPPKPQPVGAYAPINCFYSDPTWFCEDNPAYLAAFAVWYNQYMYGGVTTLYTNGQFQGIKYDLSNSYIVDKEGNGKYSLGNIIYSLPNGTKQKRVFGYNGTSCSFTSENTPFLEPQSVTIVKDELYGDFNGDGKTDKIYTYPQQSWPGGWYCKYGTSSSFKEIRNNNQLLSPYTTNPKVVDYVADVNGDGKSDIIEIENTQTNSWDPVVTTIYVNYSNGVNFIKKAYPLTTPIIFNQDEIVFGDFNGDNKSDIMIQRGVSDSQTSSVIYFNKNSKELLLQGIKDGFNNTTTFTYNHLSDDNIYTKGNTSNYPINDIQYPINVVSSVETDNGVGGNNITTYKYEDAKIHKEGKGFLGFGRIISENNISGIRTTTNYELNTTFYLINPSIQKKELINSGQLLSKSSYLYAYANLGNKRVYAHLSASNTKNYLTNFTTIKYFTYDNFGNVQTTTTTKGNLETTSTTNTYGQFGSWIPSSLLTTTTQTTRQNEPSYTRKVAYTYNTQGSIIKKNNDTGDAKELTTTFTYNNFGNPISKGIAGMGVATRNINFIYDNKGRYRTQTINALGQTSYTTYNPKWGVPLSVTGIDGLITTFQYNAFGRLTKKTTPDNLVTTTKLTWDIGGGGQGTPTTVTNAIYTNTITSSGKPTIKTWYDSFNRKRKVAKDGFNQKIYQIIAYDERGNVKTSTSPFFMGQTMPIVVTTNTYNDLNQIASSQNSIGTSSYAYNYSQNQLTTTVTKPDNTTQAKTIDATGKLIAATDNGGTLNYAYFSSGLPKEVKLNGITINTMDYDLQGNKTQLMDKNAGTSNYQYNAFGELTYQKDANNNEYQMSYDVLGRMTQKISLADNQTTYYTYVQNGNGINQLQSATNTNNTGNFFNYDNLNRISSHIENVGSEVFTTQYTYDAFNNILTTTYPSGFITKNSYNNNGYLTTIKNGNNIIWQATAMNAYNQYTNYIKGDGLTTSKTYDAYGLPQHFLASDPNVQDLAFTFDPKNDNLLSRTDATKGLIEEFSYDNLNRLTQTQVNGNIQLSTNFASNGNINFKTDAGNYTYDNNKINAAITTTNPNNDISSLQQDISYTPFSKAATINEGTNNLTFTYGPNQQRKKVQWLNNGSLVKTKYFLGNYEKTVGAFNGNITETHYIAGGDGLAAIYVLKNGTGRMYYTYTDHLGSILTLTNNNANIVAQQNFDAWGRERNPSNWTYSNATTVGSITGFKWLTRGYTGHEHLPKFGLINMNGRMYDPILARMLSPDNFVQNATSTQGFNRYSYVINNPLKFTDPSGNFAFLALGVFAAYTYLRGVFANDKQWNPFKWKSKNKVGEPINYTFGVGAHNSGVTSYSAGISVGNGPMAMATINTNTTNFIPGINFEEVNAARFNPSYDFLPKTTLSQNYYEDRLNNVIINGDEQEQAGGGGLNTASNTTSGLGVAGTGLGMIDGTFRFAKSEKFSLGYYSSGWSTGNQYVKNLYSVSKLGRGLSNGASIVTTGIAVYKISKGIAKPITYIDAGVGFTGIISAGATYFTGAQFPIVGEVIMIYGIVRLSYDLGKVYGPSTWYGNDDYKYFK